MADGDVYRATIEQRYVPNSVAVNNVLWFRQVGDEITETPEVRLGGLLSAQIAAGSPAVGYGLRERQRNDFRWDEVRVQRVWPVVTGGYTTPIGAVGTHATDFPPLPTICACVARLRSTLHSPRGRGRLYLGGFYATDNLAGYTRWSATLQARVFAWLDDLRLSPLGGLIGTHYTLGVWSKAVAGPTPPYSNGFNPIESIDVDLIIRAQRRREEGVGR